MKLRLVSDQLSVEEGEVFLERDLASMPESVPLRANETEDLPGLGPGSTIVLVANCLVTVKRSGAQHRIPMLRVNALVSEKDVAEGVATAPVGFHALVRIEAVGPDDGPLTHEHVLGVALPEGISLEAPGPMHAPLHVLLPPGEYMAYLSGPPPVHRWFAVDDGEEAVTIRLRAAPSPGQAQQ